MKLSNQAMGAIMMALQKCLLEQTDIVPILQSFNFRVGKSETLDVLNPPNFVIDGENFKPHLQETKNTIGSD